MSQEARQRLRRGLRASAAGTRLLAALKGLLADYDSIPEDAQIPDEINDPEHWDAVRALVAEIEGDDREDTGLSTDAPRQASR